VTNQDRLYDLWIYDIQPDCRHTRDSAVCVSMKTLQNTHLPNNSRARLMKLTLVDEWIIHEWPSSVSRSLQQQNN